MESALRRIRLRAEFQRTNSSSRCLINVFGGMDSLFQTNKK